MASSLGMYNPQAAMGMGSSMGMAGMGGMGMGSSGLYGMGSTGMTGMGGIGMGASGLSSMGSLGMTGMGSMGALAGLGTGFQGSVNQFSKGFGLDSPALSGGLNSQRIAQLLNQPIGQYGTIGGAPIEAILPDMRGAAESINAYMMNPLGDYATQFALSQGGANSLTGQLLTRYQQALAKQQQEQQMQQMYAMNAMGMGGGMNPYAMMGGTGGMNMGQANNTVAALLNGGYGGGGGQSAYRAAAPAPSSGKNSMTQMLTAVLAVGLLTKLNGQKSRK